MSQLTHFDSAGQARTVGVSDRAVTRRVAVATGTIRMLPETFVLVRDSNTKKGDVPEIARVAAIQDSKRTSDLIPLCRPLVLTEVTVEFSLDEVSHTVRCTIRAGTHGQTGVEMETLTVVQVGLLTIYDMCRVMDRGMVIGDVRLLEKHEGKSGGWMMD